MIKVIQLVSSSNGVLTALTDTGQMLQKVHSKAKWVFILNPQEQDNIYEAKMDRLAKKHGHIGEHCWPACPDKEEAEEISKRYEL